MSRMIFKFSIFLSFILFFLYAFTASSIAQGIKPWTNLSIYGGQIHDIAIDPCNPLKMFAGSYLGGSLFITEDGGNNWQDVLTGHESSGLDTEETFRNTDVRAVKIAPPPYNDVIWVAHGVWVKKSTDGGKTWSHIYNQTMQRDCPNCGGEIDDDRNCKSLAIHPFNPDIVYVGTGGPDGAYSPGAIYKTEDGGSTWTKLTLNPDPIYNTVYDVIDLAINPNAPDIIWALTYVSLYRSEDGGNNWSWIDSFYTCYDIEIKPDNHNEVFIANLLGVIKVYYDQDANEWQKVFLVGSDDPMAFFDVRALACDPQNSEVLYAAWKLEDDPPTVARSTNGGIDWDLYPVDYQFKTLSVHPTNSALIFGGDLNLGLFKSSDHGQTWTPINHGINAIRVYDIDIKPNNRSHIFAATSAGAYEKKGDEDWSLISNFEYPAVYSIAFHPTKSQTYYASIEGQFAKTTDGGVNWTFTDLDASGNLNNYVSDIAIHPTNTDPQTTVIFISVYGYTAERYGEIYKSIDGGDTFIRFLEGENKQGEKYVFNTVAIDPSDPNHIFAGGGNFNTPEVNGDLWESSDGGVNWIRAGLQDVVVNSLLINPNNPNLIYAGCGPGSGTDIPLYISTNGGKTFRPSYVGMREKRIALYGAWGDDPNNIFIVGDHGDIFHYNGTWSPMNSNAQKTLENVWGTSSNNVFAVGKEGIILHYDGAWSAMRSYTIEDLCGIWGTSPTNVFAVGSNGTILQYNGTWSAMDSNTTEDLWGVWGTSPTNIFAVGSNGTILQYDSIWSAMDSNTIASLSKLWGSSPTDIFVVGSDSMILHYDGNSWVRMDIDITEEDLLSIWGFSGSDIFVTGNKGSILHYNGSAWTIFKQWWIAGNSAVDLEFHPQNKNVVYAGTPTTGIYISPNQGGNWLDIGKPDYMVFAIATSSLYAGTEGGLWQCTGTGIITGQVRDNIYQSVIDNAIVYNDRGIKTISVNGEYIIVSPSGICDVTAIADDYVNKTMKDVTVYGGDVSWVNFNMQRGFSTPFFDANRYEGRGGGDCFIMTAALVL